MTCPTIYDLKPFDVYAKKQRSPIIELSRNVEDDIYTYNEMLTMLYKVHPEQGVRETKKISVPTLAGHGSRVCWTNIFTICLELNRDIKHLSTFIACELGVKEMSITDRGLLMKGRVKDHQMISLINKYATEFVVCKGCKGTNTTILKDNRLTFLVCQCGSRSSVYSI